MLPIWQILKDTAGTGWMGQTGTAAKSRCRWGLLQKLNPTDPLGTRSWQRRIRVTGRACWQNGHPLESPALFDFPARFLLKLLIVDPLRDPAF
jgi:hypothetical protein